MYRRDLLTAEIQKLALALSKLMGLKQEGKLEEANQGLNDMLEQEFGLLPTDIISYSSAEFETLLTEREFPAENLDILSQIFYLKFNPEDPGAEQLSLMQKLAMVYHILEVKHHVISMINIGRQKTVEQYIKQHS